MKDLTPESCLEQAASVANSMRYFIWKKQHQCGFLSEEDQKVYLLMDAIYTFIGAYNEAKKMNKLGFNPMENWYVAELFKIVEKRNKEVEAL